MSYRKKEALADDVLFHLKGTGVDMSYEEALGLAENLLCDPDWEIRHPAGSESTSPPVSTKQDAAEVSTTPGAMVYVEVEEGDTVPYVLGQVGVWYPVALGVHSYLSPRALAGMKWEKP